MMKSYIDYDYYTDTFNGELITESEFDRLAISSSSEIDLRIVGGVSDNDPNIEKVKYTTCIIAEILYNQQQIQTELIKANAISSEKVGDYSITYNTNNDYASNDNTKVLIDKEVNKYLVNTGLLYRGINVQ